MVLENGLDALFVDFTSSSLSRFFFKYSFRAFSPTGAFVPRIRHIQARLPEWRPALRGLKQTYAPSKPSLRLGPESVPRPEGLYCLTTPRWTQSQWFLICLEITSSCLSPREKNRETVVIDALLNRQGTIKVLLSKWKSRTWNVQSLGPRS